MVSVDKEVNFLFCLFLIILLKRPHVATVLDGADKKVIWQHVSNALKKKWGSTFQSSNSMS